MKVIIDRFEGDFAVCETENRQMININKGDITFDAKEGDVLIIEGDTIELDVEETRKRKQTAQRLVDDLWE